MKPITCLALVAVFSVAACAPSTPVVSAPPPSPAATAIMPAASTPEPPPVSLPATYRDATHGFELDFPSDWSSTPDAQIGSRGSQAQLLSPGTTAETLAPGGSRLSITVYDWDPKGDLDAYVAHRRSAWDGSGFKVTDGPGARLIDGRAASDFYIVAPDGVKAYFFLTTLGSQYLELAGEGDLDLLKTIAGTLRPLNYSAP